MYRPLHRAGRPHAIDEVLDEAQPIEVEHLLEITLGLTIAERQRYPPMSSPGGAACEGLPLTLHSVSSSHFGTGLGMPSAFSQAPQGCGRPSRAEGVRRSHLRAAE